MNLSQIKQEAREEFTKLNLDGRAIYEEGTVGWARHNEVISFLEKTLDRLTDEIEKAVVGQKRNDEDLPENTPEILKTHDKKWCYWAGANDTWVDVQEAFTHFKGESV